MIRRTARALVRDLAFALAARGISGEALAREVERACPWTDPRWRRGWQEARRHEVGLVRKRKGKRREYAGVLRFGGIDGASDETERVPA